MEKTVFLFLLVLGLGVLSCARHDPERHFRAKPVNCILVRITGLVWAIRIPSRIRNPPVTHIGNDALGDRDLVSVNIPNRVTHIGLGAFEDNQQGDLIRKTSRACRCTIYSSYRGRDI